MKDILQDIIANKRIEVERQKQAVALQTLLRLGGDRLERPTRSMRAALAASPSGIIAEFKRKSPSKGWLHADAAVADVVPAYQKSGAAACSVLTDSRFFGGSLGDLCKARSLVDLPLIRKDFIIDEYQLYQARVLGADAVLLIAACLTPEKCFDLACLAHTLDMEVLLEIHSEEELEYLNPSVDMLGVNNRNLGTFHTDVENSFRLADAMRGRVETPVVGASVVGAQTRVVGAQTSVVGAQTPVVGARVETHGRASLLLVSESGISDTDTIVRLREAGFQGFLIGETFMKTGQPGQALSTFIGGLPC